MLEGFLHCLLGDFVESDTVNRRRALLLFAKAIDQFFGEVGSDGFAFAVRVGRQVNGRRTLSQLLELGTDFLFPWNYVVLRGQVALDFNAEPALEQALDVA